MKRFAYYIACCSLVALCGCSYDDIDDVAGDLNNGKITIEASLGDLAITRAEDTSKERTVEYIDVFAVDEDDNIAYYERNTTSGNESGKEANGAGKLTLNAARRTKIDNEFVFAQGEKYKFYLVANSTVSEETMGGLATLRDLELLVQDNSFDPGLSTGERQTLLHLSGTSQGTNEDGYVAPQTFLMDAVATDTDGNEEWVVNPATGNLTNLELAAEFKRAAAKIVVNITQGEDVEFHTELEGQDSQYDFYKLPSNTFVLPSEQPLIGIELINTAPMGPNAETFIWGSTTPATSNTIQIIGYAYAHQWSDVDLTNETSLILNIPMMWNKDDSEDKSKEEAAPSSWYKVPLSKEKKFERNKCYMVNITINAVGAANRSTAIELRDIEYVTLDWEDVNIEVGNEDNKPAYLELNTDLVEMYNVNFDNSSLSFASSSAIKSVTLKDVYSQNSDGTFTSATDSYYAYYINKFGVKTNLSDAIRGTISASAETDVLNGKISILSPIISETANGEVEETHYNTIRYLEFEVENMQGIKATFRVMQYPVIYITNVQGWYSYRDDFINNNGEVVTYKLWQDNDSSRNNYTRCSYGNNGWSYSTGSGSNSLFCSKYVYSTSTSGTNQGKSRIRYFYWTYDRWNNATAGSSDVWSDRGTDNARMYHVRVTATSDTYTVGRPRMVDENGNYTTDVENGYTDDSEANAKLVSPSFMLASQLGATQSPGTDDDDMPKAADHCRYYVEVAQDGTEYHDWRLPTAAEIDIIIELQKKEEAIDEVLAGISYWSATGIKATNVSGATGEGRIRCVRDAY